MKLLDVIVGLLVACIGLVGIVLSSALLDDHPILRIVAIGLCAFVYLVGLVVSGLQYVSLLVFAGVIGLPILAFQRFVLLPVRVRRARACTPDGESVVAYWMMGDGRLQYLCEYRRFFHALHGQVVGGFAWCSLRVRRRLERAGVPHVPLDMPRLRAAVRRWNDDAELLAAAGDGSRLMRFSSGPEPLIALDESSRERMDCNHFASEFLLEHRPEDRVDIVQMALWVGRAKARFDWASAPP